ncbi:MAG: histidine--tRNA ligase [Bdellovibrionaceae bacterium]|nr:histidine--tRNA ligase [Pseudobdellovibrionaceae bacterium]
MTKLQPVRGTRDLLPEENLRFRTIRDTAWRIAQNYGFGEIETPILEFSEVFHRTLGETSDVVHKETYTFTDRNGDSLTLRPEGTAGVARAFVSEGLAQKLPLKFYYQGPMFRHERPQKGRYRQFQQLGVEALGYETPYADVEVLVMAWDFLRALGLGNQIRLEINTLGDQTSRKIYREKLVEYFNHFQNDLSEDSRIRLQKNPLRILDSKDERDKKLIEGAPNFRQSLSDESRRFFDTVLDCLSSLGIPFTESPRLVRGFDYYCHTVFEFITSSLGAQGTVLAGGRYDGLIETMGGPRTPGVGWAAGIDRLAELLTADRVIRPKAPVCVLPGFDGAAVMALRLAHDLRAQNQPVEIIWSGGNFGKKLKKADALGSNWAILIGENEIQSGLVTIKNLKTGEQKSISSSDVTSQIT